jgi:hypothetical protein
VGYSENRNRDNTSKSVITACFISKYYNIYVFLDHKIEYVPYNGGFSWILLFTNISPFLKICKIIVNSWQVIINNCNQEQNLSVTS